MKNNAWTRWLFWALGLMLVWYTFGQVEQSNKGKLPEVSYSEFMTKVKAHEIKEVEIKGNAPWSRRATTRWWVRC